MFLTLYKSNREGKQGQYYIIHDHNRDLFDLFSLTINWTNSKNMTCEKQYSFKSQSEKDSKIHSLFLKKIKEGYILLYEYPKEILNKQVL
jgi:hypothetical protein